MIFEILFCLVLFFIVYRKGILDLKGSITASLLAVAITIFSGFNWLLLIIFFMFSGFLVTKYKFEYKEKIKVSEKNRGRRGAKNVLANGLVPTMFAVLYSFTNDLEQLVAGAYIASVATVTADTFSSEIGVLSRGAPRLITSLKRVPKGTDGAISMLGELAGFFGALLIGLLAYLLGILELKAAMVSSLIGGFIGFNSDSLLGATLERRGLINNEHVNFISSLIGGISGALIVEIAYT